MGWREAWAGASPRSTYPPRSPVLRLAQGGCAGSRPADVLSKWLADDVYKSEKFRQTFGTVPHVSLAEGLRRQVDRYCSTKPAVG